MSEKDVAGGTIMRAASAAIPSWSAAARPGIVATMQPTTLLIATRNRHKTDEIAAILGNGFTCLTLDAAPGAPTPVEDASTFEGNALKKALSLAAWIAKDSGHPLWKHAAAGRFYVLADDSGLEVDALNGAPGVHSARFAALDTGAPGNSPDAENNAKLIRLIEPVPAEKRAARFRCCLALVPLWTGSSAREMEDSARSFSGACEGRIVPTPSGAGGFGYDPLFVPDGHDRSFAELGEAVKNTLSHRARALALLGKHLVQ
jgi:XTP/dITP diphosphohydrolase